MSVKNVSLVALALTLLGVGAANAQNATPPAYGPFLSEAPPAQPGLPGQPAPPGQPGQPTAPAGPPPQLSNWILYNQPCCCGPLGQHQPLRYEMYLRAGPSFPIEGHIFGRTLETGWAIEGGARMLFFNLPQTKAWTVDVGITNVHNNGRRSDIQVPIFTRELVNNPNFNPFLPVGPDNPQQISQQIRSDVGIRGLNRTFVNLAGGCEWYLIGDASCHGPSWRFGWDVGGSWGTAKAEFNEIRHRTDTVGRVFVSLHSDVEVPCGCCIFTFGVRGLWDYFWSDVLLQRQNNGEMQDIQLLGTIGVRF